MNYRDFDIRSEEQKRNDRKVIILNIVAMIIFIAVAIYIVFFADCSSLRWLPISSIPSRCLNF